MTPRRKQALLLALVGAFAAQTYLVYRDEGGGTLDPVAARGRAIWHRENCQVCHQLWGLGGFLGPDLTNAASRVDSLRLTTLLTTGRGQMPALQLPADEIAAVRAYLVALDRPDRGRGQLRLGREGGGSWEAFHRVAAPLLHQSADSAARRGRELFAARPCGGCHLPLTSSPGGPPDVSTSIARLGPDSVAAILTTGRPDRGMPAPAPALRAEERTDLVAFLTWLGARRDTLNDRLAATVPELQWRWRDLRWWEYR
ncbi:MAG: c-type cytochrome [Gemmatimonadetes bacterium]|nr:c-type cytochrome [Gemmatimonadota bacterium]